MTYLIFNPMQSCGYAPSAHARDERGREFV
jgi:hypothetical protein